MSKSLRLSIIAVIVIFSQGCRVSNDYLENKSSEILDYLNREEVFKFVCDSVAYKTVYSASERGVAVLDLDLFMGFKNNNPDDSLAIGCSAIRPATNSMSSLIMPSLIVLRVPNSGFVLNTSIELDPDKQRVKMRLYTNNKYESYDHVSTTIESGHILFKSITTEFLSPSNVKPVEGTFDLQGHYTTKDGEVLPFEITEGSFHIFLKEYDYR